MRLPCMLCISLRGQIGDSLVFSDMSEDGSEGKTVQCSSDHLVLSLSRPLRVYLHAFAVRATGTHQSIRGPELTTLGPFTAESARYLAHGIESCLQMRNRSTDIQGRVKPSE
jgi:hypothetical protein